MSGHNMPAPNRGGAGRWWLVVVALTVAGVALVLGGSKLLGSWAGADQKATFGDTVKLGDGTTVTCSAPTQIPRSTVEFPPSTGYLVQATCTITAGGKFIDPQFTGAALVSGDGTRAEVVSSVDGDLDVDSPIPPHASSTWRPVFGLNDMRGIRLSVTVVTRGEPGASYAVFSAADGATR